MKPIVHIPNLVLNNSSRNVAQVDKRIHKIIMEMKETLAHADKPKGVGLAAPQIGIDLSIFVMRPEETDPISVFINPEITWKSKELVEGIPGKDDHIEGCLSIPKVWGEVNRHQSVKLKFLDENGQAHEETFTGFAATIIQHEVDHLNGILFTQRVIEQKGQLYTPVVNDKGEEVLEPLEI